MTDQNTNDPSDNDPSERPKLSLRRAGSPDTESTDSARPEQKDAASARPKAPIRMEFKKRKRLEENQTPPEATEENKPSLKLSDKAQGSGHTQDPLAQDSEKDQELNENAFSNVQGRDPGGASSHISPSSLSFLKRKKAPEPPAEESTDEQDDEGNDLPFVPQVKIPSPSKPTKPSFARPPEEAPPPPPMGAKEVFPSQANDEEAYEEIDESLVEPPIDEISPAKVEESSTSPIDRRPPPMIKPPSPKKAASNEEPEDTTDKPLDKGLSRIPFRSKKSAEPVKSMDDLDPELAEFVEPPAGGEPPPREQPPKPRTPPPPSPSSAPTKLKAPPPPGVKPTSAESNPPPPEATSTKKIPTVLAAPPPVSPDANVAAANSPPPPPRDKKGEKKSSIIGSLIAFTLLFAFLGAGIYLIYRGITAGRTDSPPASHTESKVPPPELLTPRTSNNVINQTRETVDQVNERAATTDSIAVPTPAPRTEVGTWQTPESENLPLEIIPASREIAARASNTPPVTPVQETPTAQSTASSDQVYPVQEVSDYVDALTINGAGPSEDNPRVIISGKIFQGGAQISENPVIFFVTVDKNSREVIFRDERGAIYRKPY